MASVEQVEDIFKSLSPVIAKDADVFSVSGRGLRFIVSEADVDSYLAIRESLIRDPETSVFSQGHYEQLVDVLTPGPLSGIRILMRRDEEGIDLESQDRKIRARISGASSEFAMAVLDGMNTRRNRRLLSTLSVTSRTFRFRDRDRDMDIKNLFNRIITINIRSENSTNYYYNKLNMRHLANSCLFNLSATRGISLVLSESWERSHYRMGGGGDDTTQFPRKKYDQSLVAHYQLALSSESLVLSYLSLYKIVEFFYTSTAESSLHKQLKDRLEQPGFHYSRAEQLRSLTSIVRKFDQRYDERKKLSLVLDNHFDLDEISDWVKQHEISEGACYTETNDILGIDHSLDLNHEQIASSLAQRIYHIRNALVHNQENEMSRFVPFTGSDDILIKEMPILKFISERLIVKNGILV